MKKYTDIEIAAEVFKVVRANQDKPKSTIMKIIRQHFGTSSSVWDIVVKSLKELSVDN